MAASHPGTLEVRPTLLMSAAVVAAGAVPALANEALMDLMDDPAQ